MLCSQTNHPPSGRGIIHPPEPTLIPVKSNNPIPTQYVINQAVSRPPLLQRPRRRRPIGTRPRTRRCFVPRPAMLPPRRIHRHGNRPRRRPTILPIPHRPTRPVRPHPIIPHPHHHRRPQRRLVIPLPHLATRQDGKHEMHQPITPVRTGKSFGGGEETYNIPADSATSTIPIRYSGEYAVRSPCTSTYFHRSPCETQKHT